MNLLRFRDISVLLALALALVACGGGGSASAPVIIEPIPVLTISSVAPLSVFSGDTLQVQGVGLHRVTKVLVGGVVGNISTQSNTQLSFVVPVGAVSGVGAASIQCIVIFAFAGGRSRVSDGK